jgi:hypothetical protein
MAGTSTATPTTIITVGADIGTTADGSRSASWALLPQPLQRMTTTTAIGVTDAATATKQAEHF